MRKNKLYILSSILIITSIFATAVTCNLCGNPIEITVPEEETTEAKPEPSRETTETTQTATQTAPQSTEEVPAEGNRPPVIVEIEMDGYYVELFIEDGLFDEIPFIPGERTMEAIISIIATDEDGDELQYSAYDSRGTNFDVTKTDNNNAGFTWELLAETGPYTLTMEVSDDKDGTDSYSIDMNFVENYPPEIRGEIMIENLPGTESPEGGPYRAGGIHYRVSVEAVDPDGDPLTYSWYGGGENGYSDPTANPTNWITPGGAGTFLIRVTVSDGKVGVAEAQVPGVRVE